MPGEPSFLGHSPLPFDESFVVQGVTQEAHWGLFYKGTNLSREGSTPMTSFKPITSQGPHFPTPSQMGFGLNIWISGGHKHLVCGIYSVRGKWYLLCMWAAYLPSILEFSSQKPNQNLPCAWAVGSGRRWLDSPAGGQASFVLSVPSLFSAFCPSAVHFIPSQPVSFIFLCHLLLPNLFIILQFPNCVL